MATESRKLVLASLKEFLTSGVYSDLTITCGTETHKVHKIIVCGRAEFFARAVQFGGQESQTGKIDLSDDEPEIIKLLIHYLYEGEYEPVLPQNGADDTLPLSTSPRPPQTPRISSYGGFSPNPPTKKFHKEFPHTCSIDFNRCTRPNVCPHHTCNSHCSCGNPCRGFTCKHCIPPPPPLPGICGDASQLLTHAKMYEIGDKYDVMGLKELAKEKFSRACKHFWNTPDFAVAAHHAFSTTVDDDKGLRDIVSATICEHIELVVNESSVSVLLTQFNGLALGVLQAKIKEHRWDRKGAGAFQA